MEEQVCGLGPGSIAAERGLGVNRLSSGQAKERPVQNQWGGSRLLGSSARAVSARAIIGHMALGCTWHPGKERDEG